MSNLGIKEIKVPSNLKLTLSKNLLNIESDFGQLTYEINDKFILEITEKKSIKFYPKEKINKDIKCLWGSLYSQLKNSINGLSRGYTKTLELVGVGFRTNLDNNKLILKLGYSHEVIYTIPSDVVIKCPKQDKIIIFGIRIKKNIEKRDFFLKVCVRATGKKMVIFTFFTVSLSSNPI